MGRGTLCYNECSNRVCGSYAEVQDGRGLFIHAVAQEWTGSAAWREAITACRDFLDENADFDMEVVFAVRDDGKLAAGTRVLGELAPHLQ